MAGLVWVPRDTILIFGPWSAWQVRWWRWRRGWGIGQWREFTNHAINSLNCISIFLKQKKKKKTKKKNHARSHTMKKSKKKKIFKYRIVLGNFKIKFGPFFQSIVITPPPKKDDTVNSHEDDHILLFLIHFTGFGKYFKIFFLVVKCIS